MASEFYIALGRRIRMARQRRGLTQEELGELLKVAPATVGTYERGDRQIDIETLMLVSKALQRPLSYFLGLPEDLSEDEKDLIGLYRAADKGTRILVKLALKEG